MTAETVGIIAGAVSVILAIIAIWQAMYFYTKGKDTERNVGSALVGIKAQVDTLQSVNTKITDRLTKFVTTPRNESAQSSDLLAVALKSLPDIAFKLLTPGLPVNESALRDELLLTYIAIWHAKAETNIWAAVSLPRPEEFQMDNTFHSLCKNIVDRSAADFKYMTDILNKIPKADIESSAYAHLYREVVDTLQAYVGDTGEHFARMAKI